MCWSAEASATLAVVGLGVASYAAYKKESPALWVTLGYFSLMEALQAYSYTVINQCSLPSNQIATVLGYLHIAFQPFFINALSMYFIPEHVRKNIQYPVYFLCFVSAIIMILQLYPFDWAGLCTPGRPLCAKTLCTVSGSWHLAWDIPVNGIGNDWINSPQGPYPGHGGYLSYVIVAFILPFLYGSWRFTTFHFLAGPFMAYLLTNNVNERPAVWCLLSIAFLLIVVKTPLRELMFVRKWIFYRKG